MMLLFELEEDLSVRALALALFAAAIYYFVFSPGLDSLILGKAFAPFEMDWRRLACTILLGIVMAYLCRKKSKGA